MSRSATTEHRGTLAIIVIGVVTPLALWATAAPLSSLFITPYNTLSTIAQMAGLTGLSLYSINILLSARYQAADWLFSGLDRAYRVHRYTGISAFTLMVTHVTAVTVRAGTLSSGTLVQLWLDITDLPLNFGRVAFLGFFIVILITLFVSLRYERLKRIHQTLGVFLFLGGVHAYLIPSDIAINQPLRWYVLGLVGIGVTSYLFRTLLKPWLVPRRRFTVTAVQPLTPNITEVVLQPADGQSVAFMPGQFNFWTFIQPGFPREDHPFTITAGAGEGRLRLSAKKLGDFTSILPQLKPGATALVQGPYGGFSYQRGSTQQLWIAGGIGITPFISMARTLTSSPKAMRYTIHLFYSVKTAAEAVYLAELEEIARALPNFSLRLWVTETDGHLTAKKIAAAVPLADRDIYICGPPPMIVALTQQLRTAGVPRRRIHAERFTLL